VTIEVRLLVSFRVGLSSRRVYTVDGRIKAELGPRQGSPTSRSIKVPVEGQSSKR
jgi:hypothetical protein